ncbi:MAG: hypothetical protein ACJAS1_004986 [Oleiphilaceae bacterium]|jgi:hypothetical protein
MRRQYTIYLSVLFLCFPIAASADYLSPSGFIFNDASIKFKISTSSEVIDKLKLGEQLPSLTADYTYYLHKAHRRDGFS